MNRAKGKSERKAKNAVESLKQYLLHGHVIDEETKKELLRICDAVLNDEEPYSKSERGRKEEANFQQKESEHFQVYLLKKSGYSNQEIIDLVPQVGEERSISRMIGRLKKRLEIKEERGNHWYRFCEGYLSRYYSELLKTRRLKPSDFERIESFLEANSERTAYSEGANMFMISREDFRNKFNLSKEEERERFMKLLKDIRELTLSTNKTSKKI